MMNITMPRWSRETRDTLFLLVVIAWVVAPLYPELPVWCAALSLCLMGWRALLALRGKPLPERGWLLLMVAIAIAATLMSFRTVLGRDAGVTLIVVLLALKTLELRARRDAFVVFFLGFFLMLTRFFYSQSLLNALGMLIGFVGLLTAVVNAHTMVEPAPLKHSAKRALQLSIWGTPVMVILFMLFPRIAPLWGLPSMVPAGKSGLSAQMEVGTVASLALDPSVAFRVRFDNATPAPGDLYFRGPVLSEFDGAQWRAAPVQRGKAATDIQPLGTALNYELTLQPHQQAWLLSLEATVTAPAIAGAPIRAGADLQWLKPSGVHTVTRYKAQAFTQYRYGQALTSAERARYLAMPRASNPRTRQWAQDLIAQGPQAMRQLDQPAATRYWVKRALSILSEGGYSYTLQPGVFGEHTADEFWFDRKAGFCEHIASSYVVLMRLMGIPSRIITGYQGAQRNPFDDFWTVRQSDAHAWVEVWFADQGWQRVDPTTAVAPERISGPQRAAGSPSELANIVFGSISPDLAWRMRFMWDAVNNRWNQWVLNYEQAQQLALLARLGVTTPRWEDLIILLSTVLVSASLVAAAFMTWRRPQRDPWLRLLMRAQQRIAAAGEENLTVQRTPQQLAHQIQQRQSDELLTNTAAQAWLTWLQKMELLRYGPPAEPAPGQARTAKTLATLRQEFAQLPALKRPSN